MRIISQDGKVDFPYEQFVVAIDATNEAKILAFPVSFTNDDYFNLAEYSTKEKAKKVVEMSRTEYGNYQQAIGRNGQLLAYSFNYPKVFRFPQDSEV